MPHKRIQIHNSRIFSECILVQNGRVLFYKIQFSWNFDQVDDGDNQKDSEPKAKVQVVSVVFVVSHDRKVVFSDVEGRRSEHRTHEEDEYLEEVGSGTSINVVDHADDRYQSNPMQQFESSKVLHMSFGIDRHVCSHAQSKDEVDEERHDDAHTEPSEIFFIWEELLFLNLGIDLRKVLPQCRLKIVIRILIIQAEVDEHDNPKEGIIQQVVGLGVVEGPWECAFSEEVEDDEGDDDIFPAEEDEEVGEAIVEPPPVVQHQPVQKPELSKTEITHHCCRVTLFSNDAHADLRLLDHTHVVAAITDTQHHET